MYKMINIKTKGNALVAKKAIDKDTIILTEKTIYYTTYETICNVCFVQLSNPIRCDTCGEHTCSLKCMKFHDKDVCLNSKKWKSTAMKTLIGKVANIMDTHWIDELNDLHKIPYITNHDISIYKDDMDVKLKYIFRIIKGNSFTLADYISKTKYGIGVFLIASVINHSCNPNSIYKIVGNKISIISTRKINKDEEITISYIFGSQIMPFEYRRKLLHNSYMFNCQCDICNIHRLDHFMFLKSLSGSNVPPDKVEKYPIVIFENIINPNIDKTKKVMLCNMLKTVLVQQRNNKLHIYLEELISLLDYFISKNK